MAHKQIWPATCFCVAYKLRMVLSSDKLSSDFFKKENNVL